MPSFADSAWAHVSSGQMLAATLMITIIITTTTTTTQAVSKSRGLMTSFVVNDTINFIYLLFKKTSGLLKFIKYKVNTLQLSLSRLTK